MAYAIVASKWLGDKKYIEAVLDSADDLAALGSGYAPDSRAIVAEGGAAYMTDASGHWQELGSPGGGGGSSVTVEPLTVTQNGTQTAPSGKAYSPVTANVPNSYGASDEGKVVSNGALVAQTAHAPVTANGTIDTTLNNSVTVNVPNPNYVETINGTVGNPFGNRGIELIEALKNNNVSMILDATTTVDDKTIHINGALHYNEQTGDDGLQYAALHFGDELFVKPLNLGYLEWDIIDGSIELAGVLMVIPRTGSPTTTAVSLFEADSAILTIIHHPLPSNG